MSEPKSAQYNAYLQYSQQASLSFWPPRPIQGVLYIYGVVRTTAGPLQKEQSAFIIKIERDCLKLHEGLSKGEYCHRENKLLETRPPLIPVHQCCPHIAF